MLPQVLLLLLGPVAAAEHSVIYVNLYPGFRPPVSDVEFVAWRSGKIIWSVAPKRSGPRRYFTAHVGSKAISAALKQMVDAGVFGVKSWHFAIPNCPATAISAWDGKRDVTYTVTDPERLPKAIPHGRSAREWNAGVARWSLLRAIQRDLTPSSGKSIPRPSSDELSKYWDGTR